MPCFSAMFTNVFTQIRFWPLLEFCKCECLFCSEMQTPIEKEICVTLNDLNKSLTFTQEQGKLWYNFYRYLKICKK